MTVTGDAFGMALRDWGRGGEDPEIYERRDGFLDVGAGLELFMAGFDDWPAPERRAMRYVRGRVVDVGCGSGRVALHLQRQGADAVGTDSSPGAIGTARTLGLHHAWQLTLAELTPRLAEFDTAILFGNNAGIFGTPARVRRGLTAWSARMVPGSVLLAESTDPATGLVPTLDDAHRRRNVAAGRAAGQLRLRVRYRDRATAWFDWVFLSPAELGELADGTGWTLRRILSSRGTGPFVAVLENTRAGR
ncbi:MAG TPA: methyltransferase domain-containing protein [Acidimicrobiales bacterium]|nr:methyltransferase domain-containing protein [Acidimicrobiales bacterium]